MIGRTVANALMMLIAAGVLFQFATLARLTFRLVRG